jgi:2-polyprenyl-6-methoxyphenol hydroxylase-like FAD-dependent oxidoreductase
VRKGLAVAIAGGGIGGLTAAVALRAAGARPTVFERAAGVRHVQVGGSIHLFPNGVRALAFAGLLDAVRASIDDGAIMRRQLFQTAGGRVLADWSLDESVLGLPTLAVVRGELLGVLAGAAADMLRLGAAVVDFDADGEGVTLRLADGRQERCDVLVGADGLRSAIRARVVGDGEPVFTNYATWLAVIPFRDPALENTVRIYFGPGGRFIAWPVTGGRVYWEGIYAEKAGGVDGPGGRRADVLERFGDWANPVPAVVRATPDGAIVRADSYARRVAHRWGFGRVTLIGDAAHAMTNAAGQGANQAVEDAVVLARCLERIDDPTAALREYERLRRPRTATFVKRSRGLARAATVRNPALAATRNVLLSLGLRLAHSQHKRDLSYDAGAV